MQHKFYFTGYSDDIVIAGTEKRTVDEHYSGFYRMSNGALVKAEYAPSDDPEHPGWKITCEHPCAARILAVSENFKHEDVRVPEWLHAPGYCDVLIIESDEPLQILEEGDNAPPEATPERIMALRLLKELNTETREENLKVDSVLKALKNAGLQLSDNAPLKKGEA